MSTTKRHPKGLYLLFATEMWERFSYYGMRSIFTLYLIQALLLDKAYAAQIYGSYQGLVYLTPLLGGYIADRYWGNRRSILTGGLLMALGQFLMFFSASYSHAENKGFSMMMMMIGLGFLILGNGFFKPNISSMVGDLYSPTDSRKDSAFTIFYMGINLGAFIAPLWCGFVGDTGHPEDFKWGFLSAGVGMIFSVIIFMAFKNKFLRRPDGSAIGMAPTAKDLAAPVEEEKDTASTTQTSEKGMPWKRIAMSVGLFIIVLLLFSVNFSVFTGEGTLFANADWIGAIIFAGTVAVPVFVVTDPSLSKIERTRIIVIFIIAFFVIFFWAAFEQAGASLTYFASEQTNRVVMGWEMPTSYFQSFNAIFVVTLAPVFAMIWSMLGKKKIEPSSPTKQALGLFLLALGYLVIAFGVKDTAPGEKSSILWITALYLLHTMGELCLSPIGLSMVSKLSPVRFSSLLMGVWFLSTAAANKFAGILSSYYPEGGAVKSFMGYQVATLYDFFMLFVFMAGAAAVILFLLSKKLQNMMGGIE